MSVRKFRIAMSDRCFRFKPDSLPSHAPHKPGVYEFVTFDADKNPQVLFVGVALTGSVYKPLYSYHYDTKSGDWFENARRLPVRWLRKSTGHWMTEYLPDLGGNWFRAFGRVVKAKKEAIALIQAGATGNK